MYKIGAEGHPCLAEPDIAKFFLYETICFYTGFSLFK
jgi:hypothetical protein